MSISSISCLYLGDNPHLIPTVIRLYALEAQLSCLGCAGSRPEALRQAASEQPQALLVDFESQDFWTLKAVFEVRQAAPRAACLVLAEYADAALTRVSRSWGGDDLLAKDQLGERLAPTLRSMLKNTALTEVPLQADPPQPAGSASPAGQDKRVEPFIPTRRESVE